MATHERQGAEFEPDTVAYGTECRNCGTRVTADFARVFGDNQGRVFHCHECNGGTSFPGSRG